MAKKNKWINFADIRTTKLKDSDIAKGKYIFDWKNDDKISDPQFKKGWRPGQDKWSQCEKDFRCEGGNRSFRSVEKIYNTAKTKDTDEDIKEK